MCLTMEVINADTIDLCMSIFGLSLIESCEKLNSYFGLGLNFKSQTPKQMIAVKRQNN